MDNSKGKQPAGNAIANLKALATRQSITKCFKFLEVGHITSQYPNQHVMIIRDYEDIISDHENSNEQEDLPLVDARQEGIAQLVQGDMFVAQQALNRQNKPEDNSQRETIFHSRSLINRKVYSVIIDGGSYANIASTLGRVDLQTVP